MARILKLGCAGEDVVDWQRFLNSALATPVAADGKFGPATNAATRIFQMRGDDTFADGIVGPDTYRAARRHGFESVPPVMQRRLGAASNATRAKLFGKFAFQPRPDSRSPESIRITDDFARKNIVRFAHSELPKSARVHKLIRAQLKAALDEVAHKCPGVIKTVNGGFVPRLRRGERVFCNGNLSAHSWGSAIDLNAQWNRMGCAPARLDEEGSLRAIVEIFEHHGFYWGGRFNDGMHFEVRKIMQDAKARLTV